VENKLDRTDENKSDQIGAALAHKAGYAPNGLIEFLNHLAARNKGAAQPNGLFASHPQLEERISNINKAIRKDRLTSTATVQARYATNITFDAKPVTEVPTIEAGTRGVAGASSPGAKADPKQAEKKEEKKEEKKMEKKADEKKKDGKKKEEKKS
jgi:hypothetical protein